MTLVFSAAIPPRTGGTGPALSARSFDLLKHGLRQSPLVMLDDFRVSGDVFGPHPHAGFSAVTYVFRDSPGGVRSRDSLGNDHVVGPGGMVWSQAGAGMIHHETMANPELELHGLQFFVNLTGPHKASPPQVFALEAGEVPTWGSPQGDQVHVVSGTYAGRPSPLRPAQPFTLLDIDLVDGIELAQDDGWFGMLYARHGTIEIIHADKRLSLPAGMAMTVEGAGRFRIESPHTARPLFLAGPVVTETVIQHGPFIMRDAAEINTAILRYQHGGMGHLAAKARR